MPLNMAAARDCFVALGASRNDIARICSKAVLTGICILVLAGCTPQSKVTTADAQIPPAPSGMARVWFFRGWDAPSGQKFVYGATPTVYANGAPIGELPVGSAFFRDFPSGTYKFTVEPYGLPTPQAITLQLAAGAQDYLQAQWVASWEFGYPEAGFGFATNTFAILTTPPQVAQAYLPTLAYLGQR
jgi:hypothetical protein